MMTQQTATLYGLILLIEIVAIGLLLPSHTAGGSSLTDGDGPPGVDLQDRNPMDFVVKKPGKVPASRLKANLNTTYDGYLYDVGTVRVRTNSAGFRDEHFVQEKQANTYRIIVLGDSFTFGWGMQRNDTYVEQLEDRLDTQLPVNVQVLNFGVPGYDTREAVQILRFEGVAYAPDMVLVGYTTDEDLLPHTLNTTYTRKLDAYRNTFEGSLSEQQQQMRINLKRHELRLEQYGAEDMETSWQRVRIPLSRLENLSEQHNFTVGVFTHTYFQPPQEQRLQGTAADFGWLYINTSITHDAFAQYKLSKEDWHLNRNGHDRVTDELATKIASHIRTRLRPNSSRAE